MCGAKFFRVLPLKTMLRRKRAWFGKALRAVLPYASGAPATSVLDYRVASDSQLLSLAKKR